jgi:acyl-CoA thioester hydrolase
MKKSHDLLAGYPVVSTIPVLWGDQDAFAHVNNVVYLRWCEEVRVAYLRLVGMMPPVPPTGVAPIVASVKCDYKIPVNYPDTVQVGARITSIGNSSLRMVHHIVSFNLDRVVAEADSTLVLLDYSISKPVTVPAELRQRIGEIEGGSAFVSHNPAHQPR